MLRTGSDVSNVLIGRDGAGQETIGDCSLGYIKVKRLQAVSNIK